MLQSIIDLIFFQLLKLDPGSKTVDVIHFFVYDTIKVLLLLFVMIGIIGYVRSYIPLSKVKTWVESRNRFLAHLAASTFGALTPFCSCSSIPLFLSFVKMRIPLGVSMSFLITAPILNEYLFVLMFGYFGWKIAFVYALSGIMIGVLAGLLLDKLNVKEYIVKDMRANTSVDSKDFKGQYQRLAFSWEEATSVLKKIWKWVLVGVGIGAFLHGYVPSETIRSIVGSVGIFAVPIAVILGVPMYGSCAAIVPIAVVLFEKGMPLGTALAFMMAVSALSLPEAVILRRAMKLKFIGMFFLIVAIGIIFTGYLFNFLSPLLIQ